jgi:hypothetical protein
VEILDPTADPGVEPSAENFDLGGSLAGKTVGLRLDRAWRSYMVVVEEWERHLRRDGAEPQLVWTGERIGDAGETTRSDLDEWSHRIDCGIVGLGN